MSSAIPAATAAFGFRVTPDNDIAGAASNVPRLVYHTDTDWPRRLATLKSFSFDLENGEPPFYLLRTSDVENGNLNRTIHGQDFSDLYTYDVENDIFIHSLQQSSELGSSLTAEVAPVPKVVAGAYNATHTYVQTALLNLTWGKPRFTLEADNLAAKSLAGMGFHFEDGSTVLHGLNSKSVSVPSALPVASTFATIGLTGVGFCLIFRRRVTLKR